MAKGNSFCISMCSPQVRNNTTQVNLSSPSPTPNHSRLTQSCITTFFNVSNQQSEQPSVERNEPNTQSSEATLRDNLSSLPTYYNNVRSITNKRNISIKIEMSVYKVLCFTETWLEQLILSEQFHGISMRLSRHNTACWWRCNSSPSFIEKQIATNRNCK